MLNHSLTTEETAQQLGICTATVLNYVRGGRLPYRKLGNRYFFDQRDVDRLLDKKTAPQPAAQPERVATLVRVDETKKSNGTGRYLIIGRHPGQIEWLRQHGIHGDIVMHATRDDVTGRDVVGSLPPWLACLTKSWTIIEMPFLPAGWRDRELTPSQMDEAGARLVRYHLTRESTLRQ